MNCIGFHMYVERIANLLDFIYSIWEIFPVGTRSITETKGDLLEKEGLFTCQRIDEEGYFKSDVLKLFIHLSPLDIRDTVKYKEVMKQYPFFCLNNI